jgi:5'(3')-deoxyribonucleotidase
MIIFVDVDGVVADLHDVVLTDYNKDYQDDLKVEQIVSWNMADFAKCGTKIYNYFEIPEIYNRVKPVFGAIDGIKKLKKMGHRIVYATTDTAGTAGRKYLWLLEWGFVDTRKNYVEISDKGLLLGETLIDDAFHNVSVFQGNGILLTMPWNKSFEWKRRAKDWTEIVSYFKY